MEAAGAPEGRTREPLPRFDTPNLLWFFGAITGVGAGIAVVANMPGSARGLWIFLVALGFLAAHVVVSAFLLRKHWPVPGGVLAAAAVAFVPAVGVGFERLIGVLPRSAGDPAYDPFQHFKGAVFALGLATVVAGLVAFALVRFDFILATVAVSISVTAQFVLPAFDSRPSGDAHAFTAIVTGAVLVALGLALDLRGLRRGAFWWHVVGLLGVASGLSYFAADDGGVKGWIPMLVAGVVVLLASAPLRRASWAAYGVVGIYAAVIHYLASGLGSWKFPLVLAAVSLGILLLGIALHGDGIASRLRARRASAR